MQVGRRDLVLGVALLLLVAVAIVRVVVPDRSRLRPVSIQGLDIVPEIIQTGATIDREATWTAPADLYILGWAHRIGVSGGAAELTLVAPGKTRLFTTTYTSTTFFQNSAGYFVPRNGTMTLRYHVWNTGPPGSSNGASAMIYFVPAEGN